MNRSSTAAAALALLLAGCPLPQPLPDYPPGAVTPPRILMDQLSPREAVVRVPVGCAVAPSFDLQASLVDTNASETVTARWFVDYDRRNSNLCRIRAAEDIRGPGDQAPDPTRRTVAPFRFRPSDYPGVLAGGVVHVVELVVSNSFDPAADGDAGTLCTTDVAEDLFPFRTAVRDATVQFETQTYRWVFVNDAAEPCLPGP